MKYTIQKIERGETQTGKAKADVGMTGEDGSIVEKATIWSDFPNFASLVVGSLIEGDVKPRDYNGKTYYTVFPIRTNTLSKPSAPRWATQKNAAITQAQEKKAEQIKQAQETKEESIMHASIMRDATQLTSAQFYGKQSTVDEMKNAWQEWRKWLETKWNEPF